MCVRTQFKCNIQPRPIITPPQPYGLICIRDRERDKGRWLSRWIPGWNTAYVSWYLWRHVTYRRGFDNNSIRATSTAYATADGLQTILLLDQNTCTNYDEPRDSPRPHTHTNTVGIIMIFFVLASKQVLTIETSQISYESIKSLCILHRKSKESLSSQL